MPSHSKILNSKPLLLIIIFRCGNSDGAAPVAPPRKSKDQGAAAEDEAPKTLYEKLPGSLKSEVLVRSKVEVDEKVLKERQELTRSMSPAQVRSVKKCQIMAEQLALATSFIIN